MIRMGDPPGMAAWRHIEVHEGFEVLYARREPDGYRLAGHSTGIEEGRPWGIRYEISVDADWATREARIASHLPDGLAEIALQGDGAGGWRIDGRPAPELDGCPDVDLEASACTNALPVHRLGLAVGERADAPAAYVGFDLTVERLDQRYERLEDGAGGVGRYDYASPRFGYADVLVYAGDGFVLEYPGLARRVA